MNNNKYKTENEIMKTLISKSYTNYDDIDNLRALNANIKSRGLTGFRPTEMLRRIQSYKMTIEVDVLIEEHEMDGAQILINAYGKMFTFEYFAEDIILRKIEATATEDEPGVCWTKEQSFDRESKAVALKRELMDRDNGYNENMEKAA